MAYIEISSGIIKSGTSLRNNSMTVLEGGTANNTTIYSSGKIVVFSGGTANSTTVNSGGIMYVLAGGTSYKTMVNNGGKLFASSGAVADKTVVVNGAELFISSGCVVNSTVVYGSFSITSDVEANNTILSKNGQLHISSGAIANNTILSSTGELHISSGGIANNTVVDGGELHVSFGGIANETILNSGGITVYSGGTTTKITLNSGGITIKSGALLTDTLLNSGNFNLVSGGTANNITLSGGKGFVYGVACNFKAKNAQLIVRGGGRTESVTVDSNGSLNVSLGGITNNTAVNSNGSMNVSFSGTANNTTVNSGGWMYVESGGVADKNLLEGHLNIFSGGSANSTIVNHGGLFQVDSYTIVNSTTVNSGGMMYVVSGGTANGIIENGGYVAVANGAKVAFTSNVFNELIISSRNMTTVHSGTTANSTTVNSGGWLYVYSGGKMTGKTTFETGAYASVYSGAVIDFDISAQSPNEEARVNSLINISGTPIYTLTVSDSQENGTYILAGGASGFNSSITVQNTSGKKLGTLSFGDKIVSGETVFRLEQTYDDLSIIAKEKDKIAPTITNIQTRILDELTQPVVITANFTDNTNELASVLYRIGETGDWTHYVDEVVVSSNATIYFKAIDIYENESEIASCTISSIPVVSSGLSLSNGESAFIQYNNLFLNTVVNTFGYLYASNGGQAIETTINGGEFCVSSGGIANIASVNSGGHMGISSGGTANSIFVNLGGGIDISNGGTANDITINGYGKAYVSSGGIANIASVNSGGHMGISSGGTANGIFVNSGGGIDISNGGMANGISIKSGGQMSVSSGGTATDIVWTPCEGHVFVSNGGYATFASQYSGVYYGSSNKLLSNAIIMDNMFVGSSGEINVMNGGSVNNTTVVAGGIMLVSNGGTANSVIVKAIYLDNSFWATGDMYISLGGIANNTSIKGGRLHVVSGGTANNTTIAGNSALHTISKHGDLLISSSHVDTWGVMFVSSDGIANSIFVNTNGRIEVSNGGTANDITVNYGSVYVSSGGTANSTTVNSSGDLYVYSGGTANSTTVNSSGDLYVYSGGTANRTTVNSKGRLFVSSGGKITEKMMLKNGAVVSAYDGSILDFTLIGAMTGEAALVNNLSFVKGTPTYTLTVDGTQENGTYTLAGGATGFSQTISVVNASGSQLGTLEVGQTVNIEGTDYTLNLGEDEVLSVTVGAAVQSAARGDRDGNGVSDVMFVWTGNNYAHGYWMNGKSEWWSANAASVSADWDNLGSYDMNGDGKADAVMFGNVEVGGVKGAYIGYYQNGDDAGGWVNIGYLNNAENIAWKNKVGNLTGNEGMNSIVWHTTDIGALGVWTDGTDHWESLGAGYDANWTLIGCGDFDGDGKDSVVMSYLNGSKYYAVDLDETLDGDNKGVAKELATSDSGWEVRAIGDFYGDGKDDIIAFHKETGLVAMWGDGNSDNWSQLGQLDPADWFVVGAGDYTGDGKDDLLVRQKSTGMLGYYVSGDTSKWVELGRGVDMSWTVIA